MYAHCGAVNFTEGRGMDCLTTNVDALLTKIRRKYKEYGINEKPFVVVKADNGTCGMGIMTVRDVKDLQGLSRKTKNKMSVTKEGQLLSEVIIQEGVLTNERVNDAVAEPVVYMMDRYVVGGFYRVHASVTWTKTSTLPVPALSRWPLPTAGACRNRVKNPAPAARTGFTCTAWLAAWPCWPPVTNWKRQTQMPKCMTDAKSPWPQTGVTSCCVATKIPFVGLGGDC